MEIRNNNKISEINETVLYSSFKLEKREKECVFMIFDERNGPFVVPS
jgi:hypothetical protein